MMIRGLPKMPVRKHSCAITFKQLGTPPLAILITMRHATLALAIAILCSVCAHSDDFSTQLEKPNGTIRFATFNISHHRKRSGELATVLSDGRNRKTQQVAEIVQIVRPDVILFNEFDFEASRAAEKHFISLYLAVSQNGHRPIQYPHAYADTVNTGVDSNHDLNNDGKKGGAADCFGYGDHPGQYGMLVLSMFPIDKEQVRTFRKFLWKDMPNAQIPVDPNTTQSYYSQEELDAFRLSSKSHWDIPIRFANQTVHLLAAHPTPPVFDGPEDRNGKRNHDEIRLFADYVDPGKSGYVYDDAGRSGGLAGGAKFIIAGDLNADPYDGDSSQSAIRQLLDHSRIDVSTPPASPGGQEQSEKQRGANSSHQGNPSHDTADFGDRGRGSGNLRVDYVLPSKSLRTLNSGVFWPTSNRDEFQLVNASDHRLVWIDVSLD